MARAGFKTYSAVPAPEPTGAVINTSAPAVANDPAIAQDDGSEYPASLRLLYSFAEAGGDISHLLDPGEVGAIGIRAVREWEIDDGTRTRWKRTAERSLELAAQESDEDGDGEGNFSGVGDPEGLWENSADIHYPLLTTASQQFAARAAPELVRGDKVVGVKAFSPPPKQPSPGQLLANTPQPQGPPQGPQGAPGQPGPQPAHGGPAPQQAAPQGPPQGAPGPNGAVPPALAGPQQQPPNPALAAAAQETQAEAQQALKDAARQARAQRVATYLNWLIFYKMDDWEGDTDLLLHQIPITGAAFKKVYMGSSGLCSDYVSALRLTVHNGTKSLYRCPRITEDFEVYPFEIKQRQRSGIYRDVVLPPTTGEDPEAPRKFIEQHRLDDLDGDGLAEPYVVTVDFDTKTTMRIEPAYTLDDVQTVIGKDGKRKVTRIDRWNAYSAYLFLPDPRGRFYGIGFGRLLESITDSVDTSVNQLLDAGTAEIAGGGFIASGVRLQGSGAGGAAFFRPGEYQTVGFPGGNLQQAIWERTVPHPSDVTFKLLELLLAAAKDVASVKDVITGDAPSTAPVGTTLALQNAALSTFSAIYKRVYRGFRDEFQLMYKALRRWGGEREAKEYLELTQGDFKADFSGDGTDIQPVADPAVVTKMQKMARHQAILQFAETPIGAAAGMTQPGPAQEIARDFLETIEVQQPDRYLAQPQPDPLAIAKAADLAATAKLKNADAELRGVETHADLAETGARVQEMGAKAQHIAAQADEVKARTTLTHAKTLREVGLAAQDTHDITKETDRIARTGMVADPEAVTPPSLIPPEPPEGNKTNGQATGA